MLVALIVLIVSLRLFDVTKSFDNYIGVIIDLSSFIFVCPVVSEE